MGTSIPGGLGFRHTSVTVSRENSRCCHAGRQAGRGQTGYFVLNLHINTLPSAIGRQQRRSQTTSKTIRPQTAKDTNDTPYAPCAVWHMVLVAVAQPLSGSSLLGIVCFPLFYPVLYKASAAGSCGMWRTGRTPCCSRGREGGGGRVAVLTASSGQGMR